jgi:hypothetical protein
VIENRAILVEFPRDLSPYASQWVDAAHAPPRFRSLADFREGVLARKSGSIVGNLERRDSEHESQGERGRGAERNGRGLLGETGERSSETRRASQRLDALVSKKVAIARRKNQARTICLAGPNPPPLSGRRGNGRDKKVEENLVSERGWGKK